MQRYDCTPEVGCVRQRGAYLSDAEIYTNVYVDYTDEYKGVSRPVFEKKAVTVLKFAKLRRPWIGIYDVLL